MNVVEVFAEGGRMTGAEWLARAEGVHRQLRPHLPADYAAKMMRVLEDARMAIAVIGETVLGLAVYRWHENTSDGLKFYIDDLVTDEARRSEGVGHVLIAHLEQVDKAIGCKRDGAGFGNPAHAGTQQ